MRIKNQRAFFSCIVIGDFGRERNATGTQGGSEGNPCKEAIDLSIPPTIYVCKNIANVNDQLSNKSSHDHLFSLLKGFIRSIPQSEIILSYQFVKPLPDQSFVTRDIFAVSFCPPFLSVVSKEKFVNQEPERTACNVFTMLKFF